MTHAVQLPQATQNVIDDYVNNVDAVLQQSNVSPSERQAICDELECLTTEKLIERCTASPSAADAEALLAEMDPPSQWARQYVTSPEVETPSVSRMPSILPLAIVAPLLAIIGVGLGIMTAEAIGGTSGRLTAAVVSFLVTGLATTLGITAIRQMKYLRERRGYFLAFIGAMSFPAIFLLWGSVEISIPIFRDMTNNILVYNRYVAERERQQAMKTVDATTITNEPNHVPPTEPWTTSHSVVRKLSYGTAFGIPLLLIFIIGPYCYLRFDPNRTATRQRTRIRSSTDMHGLVV